MMKSKTSEKLEKFQIDFIRNKVKELKSYNVVCEFYNQKDAVSAFAKREAAKLYDIDDGSDNDLDNEPEVNEPVVKKVAKKCNEKPEVVRRKRNIKIDE